MINQKNLVNTINKLRGVSNSFTKKKDVPASATSAEQSQNSLLPSQQNLDAEHSQNMNDLTNFINSSEVPPAQDVEKKYTMEDLDNFIESLVKPK